MFIRPPLPAELQSIESTRCAYRAMWKELKNVPRREFDGGREDIDALDFIDYEAGRHPEGLAGAAIIWGGVLVATGALSWAIGDEQHFVLVGDPDFPRALIFPYARIAEIHHSSCPQFGKFKWLLDEVILRLCAQGFDDEHEQKLRSLLSADHEGFIHWTQGWLKSTK